MKNVLAPVCKDDRLMTDGNELRIYSATMPAAIMPCRATVRAGESATTAGVSSGASRAFHANGDSLMALRAESAASRARRTNAHSRERRRKSCDLRRVPTPIPSARPDRAARGENFFLFFLNSSGELTAALDAPVSYEANGRASLSLRSAKSRRPRDRRRAAPTAVSAGWHERCRRHH